MTINLKDWSKLRSVILSCYLLELLLFVSICFARQEDTANKGLASITTAEIKAHLSFLASDLLEGRGTGMPGLEFAAAYIAAQFQGFGLSPVGDDRSYFQKFDLTYRDKLESSALELTTLKNGARITSFYEMGHHYGIFSFSSAQKVVAPLAFVGYGITAPEYGYDDYQGIDVRGKVVLMLRHEPRERDSTSIFKGIDLTDHVWYDRKAKNAQKHGAVGMLFVNDPMNHQADKLPGRIKEWPKIAREIMELPALWITVSLANDILRSSGKTTIELQEEIDSKLIPSSFIIKEATITIQTRMKDSSLTVKNVAGMLKGKTDETIVIGAHYDHEGIRNGEIYNGADDNASGTTGLLELAEAFSLVEEPLQRSLLFMAFTAEEHGLFGSEYYVKQPLTDLEKTVAMVNLDMIGRNEDTANMSEEARRGFQFITEEESKNIIYAIGTSLSGDLKVFCDRANQKVGFEILYGYDNVQNLIGRSDQLPFIQQGIPSLFFTSGPHPDYHKPTDTTDKIDLEKMSRIIQLAFLTIRDLGNTSSPPKLDEPLSTR